MFTVATESTGVLSFTFPVFSSSWQMQKNTLGFNAFFYCCFLFQIKLGMMIRQLAKCKLFFLPVFILIKLVFQTLFPRFLIKYQQSFILIKIIRQSVFI